MAVTARAPAASASPALPRRLLLQHRDGRLLGLVVRQRGPGGRHHAGYLLPGAAVGGPSDLRLLAVQGADLICLANC